MKINKKIDFTYDLNEAFNKGLRYALLDSEGNIRHKPVRCKDYFQDVYWSELLNKGKIKQYGFEWDGDNDNPISGQEFVNVLLISDEHQNIKGKHFNIQSFLNDVELILNIPNSIVQPSPDDDNDLILTYNNEWSKRPYLISMLYLFIRIGLQYENQGVLNFLYDKSLLDKVLQNDSSVILNIIKKNKGVSKIDILFEEKILPEQNWKDYVELTNVHNNSGIMNFKMKINERQELS